MDSMLGIMQLIKNKYSSLTPVERKICDYLAENYEKLPVITAETVAIGAGVAKSAVVRCSKSLGFSGFSALKGKAAAECVKNESLNYCPYISPQDGHRQILGKVFAATVKTLNDTAEGLDYEMAEQLIAALSKAESIYIYGVGTSAILVSELQYQLITLGYSAFAFSDVPTMAVSTMNLKKGDIAIALSYSGRTSSVLETLKLAKQGGALTACITANSESPIMQLCDIPLAVYSDEINYPIEPMSARIAQISLINALIIMLSSNNYEETLERSRRKHELVDKVRSGKNEK